MTLSEIPNFTYIKEQARPFLSKLCDDIEESVLLTMIDGIKPFRIDQVVPQHVVQVAAPQGGNYPLHCTANGKIHLAYMDDKIIDSIISIQGLEAYTEDTITDTKRLKEEIQIIRRDDIAFDDEEYIPGVKSAAAPIKCENGSVIAVVSFVGLSIRVSSLKMRQLGTAVKNCAENISRSIGYKLDD